MIDGRAIAGTHDALFVTLDTLRYDVAVRALERGRTPEIARWLPGGAWERRHSPGSFTYAAHAAFFAGFLPTPARPGRHSRLFAARFPGSETTNERTLVFDTPDIVTGFAAFGYHTLCIGGVGFFNKASPLGRVFPALFAESHWQPAFGVAARRSTEAQVACAVACIDRLAPDRRLFLFLNVSAMHQPNRIFLDGAGEDGPETQEAALAYADRPLGALVRRMAARRPLLLILCSDHGTAYGEDGYSGHRLAHPVVWEVPYAEAVLPKGAGG